MLIGFILTEIILDLVRELFVRSISSRRICLHTRIIARVARINFHSVLVTFEKYIRNSIKI